MSVEVAEVKGGPPQTLFLLGDYEEAIVVSPAGGVHHWLFDLFLKQFLYLVKEGCPDGWV